MASGAVPTVTPSDPAGLLQAPLGKSGLTAQATLRRAGIRLGWYTVRDLLFHLPRRYDDLREMQRLGDLIWVEEGTVASARVQIDDIHVEPDVPPAGAADRGHAGRRDRHRAGNVVRAPLHRAAAESWRHGRRVRQGQAVRPQAHLRQPRVPGAEGDAEVLHAGRIVPVYPLTAGLTSARLRSAIREALDRAGDQYPEYLPAAIREPERLPPINVALEEAHYPSTFEARDAALRRLAFDELLALQIGMVGRRRQRTRDAAPRIEVTDEADAAIRAAIVEALAAKVGRPLELTPDQASAIDALRGDLARPTPMLRLLQGDVGSGKTAVAAWALAAAAQSGRQGALLAPTDLLARQHLGTVAGLLDGVGVPVTLLTGSLSADDGGTHSNRSGRGRRGSWSARMP